MPAGYEYVEESWLERKFKLQERGSSVWQEFRAALATFFTMSYILLVNPQLLAKIGLDPSTIVVSTAFASAVGCFLAGFFGNVPLGLAPGVGLSTYLAYGLVFGQGLSPKEAFTCCFISGLVVFLCTVTNISELLMKLIPRSVKIATIVGMGLQIALVGMTSVHLVVANEHTIVGLGDIGNVDIWLCLGGLVLIGSLLYHQVPGAILWGIALLTFLTYLIHPKADTAAMTLAWPNITPLLAHPGQYLDLSAFSAQPLRYLPGIAAFTFIGLIDVSGVIYGMIKAAGLLDESSSSSNSSGAIPGAKATFFAVSLASLLSAVTGGTPIIVYVESASGIKEGGKTGLLACWLGLFFLLAIPFSSLLAMIPATATAPVAILIGAMMMSQASEVAWDNMAEAIPAFLTAIVMPFTFSITDGIVLGLLAAWAFYLTTGQAYADLCLQLGYPRGEGGEGANSSHSSQQQQQLELQPIAAGAIGGQLDYTGHGHSQHGHSQHDHGLYSNGQAAIGRTRSDSISMVLDNEAVPFERTPSLILCRQQQQGQQGQGQLQSGTMPSSMAASSYGSRA